MPERLVHTTGRTLPGQFGGAMGARHDPWFIEASPFDPLAYGAYPRYEFDHQERAHTGKERIFQAPSLSLPEGVGEGRLASRLELLRRIDRQRADMERAAEVAQFDHYRQGAVSLLAGNEVRGALDVTHADSPTLDRYGRNSFGWSLLMARRLVEVGVPLIQVNLGNNETWDTHGNAFPHLKEHLLPPMDRSVAALLDDLHERGLLESTMVVMAGEFGRTPKVTGLPQFYKLPGRDHWGAAQTVFFAGGGVRGGQVIGETDAVGGSPKSDGQTPESFAASIYQSLGIPRTAEWEDTDGRPHQVYNGEPIPGLAG